MISTLHSAHYIIYKPSWCWVNVYKLMCWLIIKLYRINQLICAFLALTSIDLLSSTFCFKGIKFIPLYKIFYFFKHTFEEVYKIWKRIFVYSLSKIFLRSGLKFVIAMLYSRGAAATGKNFPKLNTSELYP